MVRMENTQLVQAERRAFSPTHVVALSGAVVRRDFRYSATGVGILYLTVAGETLEEGRSLPYYIDARVLGSDAEALNPLVEPGAPVVIRGVLSQYRREGERERTSVLASRVYLAAGRVNEAGRLVDGINSVTGYARVVGEPALRTTEDGTQVASLRVAFQGRELVFMTLEAWGPMAQVVAGCLKGDGVVLEGRLRSTSWVGSDGAKRYETRVVARRLVVATELIPRERGDQAAPGPDLEEFPEDLPF